MLDHALEAIEMCRGLTGGDLNRDRKLTLAVIKLIEIVGEAANRVSGDGKRQHGLIPWSKMVGMRNRLIHGYDEVDFDILWDTIQIDLPDLVKMLKDRLERA